ncbi:MAG: hypothetical protein MJ025_02205, partial [Victivallaceae bacterium]|nr:hypothetical protein [Victivallaceae bacterium]
MRHRLLRYTFTEMMVVIAVATIILTMGVEHGIKSRARAAGSSCFSNMGQMAVANAAYMADWKNFLPRAESDGADVK